jgi:hypothetical protein
MSLPRSPDTWPEVAAGRSITWTCDGPGREGAEDRGCGGLIVRREYTKKPMCAEC